MKKIMIAFAALTILAAGWAIFGTEEIKAEEAMARVKMTFNDQEVIAEIFDNEAGRDFMALLPYTGSFEDFGGAEKISYLPRKLSTKGSPSADQLKGDFTYYAPWGNLAVFYKGDGYGGSLYTLGRIVSGKDKLRGQKQGFTATIEKID